MQTGILWWSGVAVFFINEKKLLHQNALCWRKYELIFATLYILQMTIQCRNCFVLFRFYCARHVKFRASSRAESKLITLQWEFAIFLVVQSAKCQNDAQMTHFDWQLELNRTNEELRSWAKIIFFKIRMTSGRRNLHFPTPTLLIFYRRPPPWYKFLSLPSLPLPLKSKMMAIIFVMGILSTCSPKLRLLCRLNLFRTHEKSRKGELPVKEWI